MLWFCHALLRGLVAWKGLGFCFAQVPAVTCRRMHGAALDGGQKSEKSQLHNAARDAMRMVRRKWIGWNVPLDVVDVFFDDGSSIQVTYLDPAKLLTYLMDKHPSTLTGCFDLDHGKACFKAFWDSYRTVHSTHELFAQFANDLHHTIPVAIHGDEGRGKRRSNTTIITMEAILGLKGHTSLCNKCTPSCGEPVCLSGAEEAHELAKTLRSNLKGPSFVQHFPFCVVPGVLGDKVKVITEKLLSIFSEKLLGLFSAGFEARSEHWRVACVAAKGDLKWHAKVGRLVRGYEGRGRVRDLPSCHLCKAGVANLPAEDYTANPIWEHTLYSERPWRPEEPPLLAAIPFDASMPEYFLKCDQFHNLKLGIHRHFVASCIFQFLRYGFFGSRGKVDDKLTTAYGHFKVYLQVVHKFASLRSFSPSLFSYKSSTSYPWCNTKASDTSLIMDWIATIAVGFLNSENLSDDQRFVLDTILSTTRVGIAWFDIVYKHGLFLAPDCALRLYEVGHAFVVGYSTLAHKAMANRLCLFALIPKLHFQCHTLVELRLQIESGSGISLSPVCFDCCMNEDVVGRLSRLSRRSDTRVTFERVLSWWLVKAGLLFKRHYGSLERKGQGQG